MRLIRAAGFGLMISLALSGCVPPSATRTPAEVSAEENAAAMAREGRFDQAAQAYLALAQNSPAYADHYRLLAAEAYRQEGRLEQAAPFLSSVKRTRLAGDEPVRLDLLQAESALKQNDPHRALQLVTQPGVAVPGRLQLRMLELRANAMDATGDVWGAARSRAILVCNTLGIRFREEIRRHRRTDDDYKGPNPALRQLLCVMCAKVSADDCTQSGHGALWPIHRARHNKRDHSDAIDDPAQHNFQSIHGVNVRHAEGRKHGQIHDADSPAKISTVDRNNQFEYGSHNQGLRGCLVLQSAGKSSGQFLAERKQQRRTQHQPWDYLQERMRRGLQQ